MPKNQGLGSSFTFSFPFKNTWAASALRRYPMNLLLLTIRILTNIDRLNIIQRHSELNVAYIITKNKTPRMD